MNSQDPGSSKPLPTYSPPRKKATAATALLLLLSAAVLTSIVLMTMEAMHFQSLTSRSAMTAYEVNRVHLRVLFTTISHITLFILSGIFFFIWLHRASKNMWSLSDPDDPPRETPGWTIICWFIPFISFVIPYKAVKELWQRSNPQKGRSRLILIWWLLFLLLSIAINAYLSGGDTQQVSSAKFNSTIAAAAGLITLIDSAMAIILIWQITRGQERQKLAPQPDAPNPANSPAASHNAQPSNPEATNADPTQRFRWPETASTPPPGPPTEQSPDPQRRMSKPKGRLFKTGAALFITGALIAGVTVIILVTSQGTDSQPEQPTRSAGPAIDVEESNRLREMAKASYDQGKYNEALDHLKRAQETLVYPHPVVQKEIALTLGQLHQYEEAIHYYGISLHLQEDHFTRLNRAFAFLGAGRWTEAKADADQALSAMAMGNTPTTSTATANEVLAYAEAKLERHNKALAHADTAVKHAINANISANWVQKMTSFVDMVNEVRREKGTSEDIVIFPSLGQMTEGLAWLETGDIKRAHQLLLQSQTLHQGDSWFIESALAKVSWQLGNETQAIDHLFKTIMRREQAKGQGAKQEILQALQDCDLEASSRTTYGTYQWSTCPEDQVTLAIHNTATLKALQEAKARDQGRFNEITALYEEAKQRESGTPVPDPTPVPWPTQTPRPMPTATPFLLPLSTEAPAAVLHLSPTNTPPARVASIVSQSRVVQTTETGLGQTIQIEVTGFDNSPDVYNLLVQVINQEELLLGIPFPSPKLTMTRVNRSPGGFCGNHQPTYKGRRLGDPYIVQESRISLRVDDKCEDTFGSIAHEVAHAWFHGNDPQNWVDEGLANSIEQQMKENNPGQAVIYPLRNYCATYRNISELERANPIRDASTTAGGFSCNYRLGNGVFEALRHQLGTRAFNRALTQMARREINTSFRANTVTDVKRLLGVNAQALEIIDSWYTGAPTMKPFRHLNLVHFSYLPTLDGPYLHFAGKTDQPDLVLHPIIGKDNLCSQFHIYQGLADPDPVTGLADPLPVGWKHTTLPQATIINYDIDPSNGEFSVTARLNDHSLTTEKDLSLQVSTRSAVDQNNQCRENTNLSQVLIQKGPIPDHLKKIQHYHNDQIQWASPPSINDYQINLSGKAPPGTLFLHDREEYCGQFSLYQMDDAGYHLIDSVNPMLPTGQHWTTPPKAEIISGHVSSDGNFQATIQVWDPNAINHAHLILRIRTAPRLNQSTNECAPVETMSAVSLKGN